jgi:proline iminopeptidase
MPPMPADPPALDPDALSWQTLPLSDGATMAWCQGGDPAGLPVVVLHGGPGGRTRAPTLRWWQDLPVRWIAYDQRGCGRSTPRGGLQGNDLGTLLQDLERLREHLGLARWAVVGGSWGALLAVAYAAHCPQRVTGLFLRSRFTGSEAECRRYMAPWAEWLGPDGRAALGAQGERLLQWVCQGATALCDDGSATFEQLAQDEALAAAWAGFDDAQSAPGGVGDAAAQRRWRPGGAVPAVADWRVFLYLAGQRFGVGAAGVAAPAVPPGPVWLVHGEADAVCDPAGSAALATAWPAARHVVVPGGAHAMSHPPMAAALQGAARAWAAALQQEAQVFQRSLR